MDLMFGSPKIPFHQAGAPKY